MLVEVDIALERTEVVRDFSNWASTSSSMLDCWNICSRLA
jgi:hypothetical protein